MLVTCWQKIKTDHARLAYLFRNRVNKHGIKSKKMQTIKSIQMKQRLSYFLRVILYGSVTRSWQVSYADRNGKPGADKQPALEATPENRTNKVFYKGHMLGIYFRFACVFGMLLTLLTSFTLPVIAQTWQCKAC